MNDLIKKLRGDYPFNGVVQEKTLIEAADKVQSLTARLEAVEEEVKRQHEVIQMKNGLLIDALNREDKQAAQIETLSTERDNQAKAYGLLAAENWKQAAQIEALQTTIQNCHEVIGYKEAAIEALKKDAERYRWLRDPDQDVAFVIDKVVYEDNADDFGCGGYKGYEYKAGEELDAAIDAAREGKS